MNKRIDKIANIISIVLIIVLVIGLVGYITNGFSDWSFGIFNDVDDDPVPMVPDVENPIIDEPKDPIEYDNVDYWVDYAYCAPSDHEDIMMYYDSEYLEHIRDLYGDPTLEPFRHFDYIVQDNDFIFYEYIDLSGDTDYSFTQTEFKDNTFPNLDFNKIDSVMIEAEGLLKAESFVYDIDNQTYIFVSELVTQTSNFIPEYEISISNLDKDGSVLERKLLISYKVSYLDWEEKDYINRARIRITWGK